MVVGPQVDATLVVAMAFAIDVPGRAMRGLGGLDLDAWHAWSLG